MHGFALNCDVDLGVVRPLRALRHQRRRRDLADRPSAGATSSVAEVAPLVSAHLRTLLAWEPYERTPDYEPRPEPGSTSAAGAGRACPGPQSPALTPLRQSGRIAARSPRPAHPDRNEP